LCRGGRKKRRRDLFSKTREGKGGGNEPIKGKGKRGGEKKKGK